MVISIFLSFSLLIVKANHTICEEEWEKIYDSKNNMIDSSIYSRMYQASGLTLNTIGNYKRCNSINHAKYVVFYCSGIPNYALTLCGPDICTVEDYQNFTSVMKITKEKPSIVFPKEFQEKHYGKFTTGAIFMLVFISFIALIAIIATILDKYLTESFKKQNKLIQILLCFSLKANTAILLSPNRLRNGNKDPLEIINGVRVMSQGWIVLGHTCMVIFKKAVISNYDTLYQEISNFQYTFVFTLYYAVNTFFWMSGFLMSFLLLSSIKKQRRMTLKDFFMIYVHRYLRLTPSAMFVLCFLWTLTVYIGSGPLWIHGNSTISDCDNYWFTNLFYLNNMIPNFKGNKCFSVEWYLAADMQCFYFFPIIIIIYTKYKKEAGWICIGILCIIGIIGSAIAGSYYNLSPSHLSSNTDSKVYNYLYTKPYAHIGPYSLGVASGFIIYSYRTYQDSQIIYDKFAFYLGKIQENIYWRISVFITGLLLVNVIFFATYDLHSHPGNDESYLYWSSLGNIFYIGFENTTFALGISLMLLPLLLGHFQLISNFMSLYIWNILAKLTYGGYLVNYYLIRITLESQQATFALTNYENLKNTVYFYVGSLVISLPLFLLIESPASNLEQLFFRKQIIQRDKTLSAIPEIPKNLKNN